MGSTVIRQLRIIGLTEGLSFLILLGVAMPLKYLGGMPMAVRIVGMAHGVLFVLYVAAIVHTVRTLGWPLGRGFRLAAAAVLPGGPFAIEPWLRREQAAASAREPAARAD